MLSLRELISTAPETLLYIERFQPNKLVPDFLIMTAGIMLIARIVWLVVMTFLLLMKGVLYLAF